MFKFLAILFLLGLMPAAMPLMKSDMTVGQEAKAAERYDSLVVSVTVDLMKGQRIRVGDEVVSEEALVGRIVEVTKNNLNSHVYLRADRNLSYEWAMGIMARIQAGGYPRVALIAAEP